LASLRDAPKLTHHEAIVGTPAYMSPEQAAGGVPGESSDLFSLGVVLWEAATGESPFLAKTVIETLRNVRERELAFDHPAITALPIEAQTLLRGLLEKDTDKRIPTAAAALSVLEGAAPPERRTDSARRNRLYLAAAALVVAIWAVLMFRGPKEEPIPASSDSTSVAVRSARSLPPPTDLRAPSSGESDSVESAVPVEEQTDRTPVASERDMTATRTDSVLLYLTTEPWAHVYVDGVQLGTTPLAQPLRLPAGQQEITLRNPAYPPIELPLTLEDSICYRRASLAEYVGLVRLSVVPWGELYLDGEHVGTSPLTRPLFVSPGRHTLRISHPQLAALQQDVTVAPGETLAVDADLAQSHLSVKAEGGGSRQ